jgi:CYTH domain-containing protein
MALEIERKFLMKEFPSDLEVIREVDIWQGYVSIDPEVRIHKAKDRKSGVENFRLTLKGDGTLTRTEIKTDIDGAFYQESLGLIAGEVIYKDYRSYRLGDDILEVCHVDPGKASEFLYAEIEFKSEEEANAFIKPDFLGEDVTDNDYYKMKNYWKRTRLFATPI